MADFITLTCPSCGGKLQITQDMDRFACGFCGTEHIVRRTGGTISLAPVVEGLKNVQKGVDKTASELAIVRLTNKITELSNDYEELDTYLTNNKRYWTIGIIILIILFGAELISQNMLWIVIFGVLTIGAFVGLQRVKDDEGKKQLRELIKKYQIEMKYHEDIVRHN